MEIEIVKFFQSFANRFLDVFFWLITKMGEETFFLLMLMLIYICYDKFFAFKFSFYYIISVGINNFVKIIFARPRPFLASDSIKCRLRAWGNSFPSGHSQGYFVSATTGMVEIHKKNKCKPLKVSLLIAFIVFGVLMMISRMYWGQHYLSDVLVGMSFGIAIPFVIDSFLSFLPKSFMEKITKNLLYLMLGIVTFLLFFVLLFVELKTGVASRKVYKFVGIFLAMSIGYFVDKKIINYKPCQGFWMGVVKFLISTVLLVAIYYVITKIIVFQPYVYFLVYLFLGLIATIVLPLCFKFIFKRKVKDGSGNC